jgi:hypothetical protein
MAEIKLNGEQRDDILRRTQEILSIMIDLDVLIENNHDVEELANLASDINEKAQRLEDTLEDML